MNLNNLSINDQVGLAGMVLTNTMEEISLMDALASRSYDQTKIDVGIALRDAVKGIIRNLKSAEFEGKALTVEFNAYQKETHGEYMELVKTARFLCRKDPKKAEKLGLNTPRIKRSVYDWLQQAQDFNDALLADNTMVEAFAYRGFTLEHLQGVQTKLDNVEALKKRKQLAYGRVQTLRVDRDEAMDTLLTWLKDFLMVLEYAVKENPQQLEKVGIQVYTDAYLARKRALAKKAENPDSEPSDQDPTDPVPTDPTNTEPGSTEPTNTEPGSTEPATENPGTTTENTRRKSRRK